MGRPAANQTHLDQRLAASAASGSLDAMRRLILDGANPRFDKGLALAKAAKNGHAECVRFLIPISDMAESSAVCLAALHGHIECVKLLASLCDHKANALALGWAVGNGHMECATILASALDPEGDLDYGHDLRVAAHQGNIDGIKMLAPFCSLSNDPSPLFMAVEAGQAKSVSLILSLAPTLVAMIDFDAAIHKARRCEHHDLAALLQSIHDRRELSDTANMPDSAASQGSASSRQAAQRL